MKEASILDRWSAGLAARSSTRRKHVAIILPKPLLSLGEGVINLPMKGAWVIQLKPIARDIIPPEPSASSVARVSHYSSG